MLKLYKFTDAGKHYSAAWENSGVHTVHWGELKNKGEYKKLNSSLLRKAETQVQAEINRLLEQGDTVIEDGHTAFDRVCRRWNGLRGRPDEELSLARSAG